MMESFDLTKLIGNLVWQTGCYDFTACARRAESRLSITRLKRLRQMPVDFFRRVAHSPLGWNGPIIDLDFGDVDWQNCGLGIGLVNAKLTVEGAFKVLVLFCRPRFALVREVHR